MSIPVIIVGLATMTIAKLDYILVVKIKPMTPRKPKTDQKRLPRKSRAKNPPAMQLTDRDAELLRVVLEYRFLTIELFTWLFPQNPVTKENSAWGITNRLRLLYHHGYLNRENLPVSKSVNQMIYSMTEKGAMLLAELDGVSREDIPWNRHLNKVTPTHINHLLAINQVLIAMKSALEKAQEKGEVQSFKLIRAEPSKQRISVTLKSREGRRREISVIPDAVLAVIFKGRKYEVFFIEIDRATMTTKKWQEKITVYREYQRSPQMQEEYRKRGFVVLTATTSDRRIDSLARSTIEVGGQRGYWFTKLDEVSPEQALNSIWVRASDLYQMKNERMINLSEHNRPEVLSLLDAVER